MIRSVAEVRPRAATILVPLARLTIKPWFREDGLNDDHVQRLVALGGRWPPILIHQDTSLVIDGVHRVAAARLLSLEKTAASLFSGDEDEALIEFVRRNVYHGLPLTLRERKRAATRILLARPDWSDRRIAEVCALSPKTVGRLRVTSPDCPAEEIPRLDTRARVGRDNKYRPVNTASVRTRVIEAIKEQPGASLRSVAASVGVSPETVRIVRMNMNRPPVAETGTAPVPRQEARPQQDLALASSAEEQEGFVAWFNRTSVGEDVCTRWVGLVPLSRAGEAADEARRRAGAWLQFAQALDARTGEIEQFSKQTLERNIDGTRVER
jgi:ParB-like chromosome segregation protein Spo0J